MPIAFNEKTGEALALGADGQWSPTKIAVNPQTGERLALDGEEWKPIGSAAKSAKVGLVPNLIRQAANGATFGLADEFAAGMDSALGIDRNPGGGQQGSLYERNLATQRGVDKQFEDEHPIASTAANVAGGVGGMLAGGMGLLGHGSGLVGRVAALPAMRAMARQPGWLKVGETSAAAGGATGFGEGEGGFGERLENAAQGAVVGGLLGSMTPAAVRAIGAVATPVINRFSDPAKVASQKIMQALGRDGLSPADLTTRLDDMGPNAALVDAGGENLSSLGRAAAGVPGKAKARAAEFLDERQAGQVGRVSAAAKEGMGDVGSYYGTVDDLLKSQEAAAGPAYRRAREEGLRLKGDQYSMDDLLALMKRKPMQEAWKEAQAIAETRGETLPELFVKDADGALTLNTQVVPDLTHADYMKRGFDAYLAPYRDPTTKKLDRSNPKVAALDDLRREYLGVVDDLAPAYKEARGAFAGPAQSLEALEDGRAFIRNDAEITAKQLERLSDGDKTFFRAGAYRAIKDQIEATPDAADAVKRIFGSEGKRAKLRAVFPSDEAFAKFEKAMTAEAEFFKTRFKVLGGSQTAQRAAEMSDLPGGDIAGVAMDVATGNTPSLIRRGANWVVDRARVPTERLADPLSSMLFTPGQGNSAIVQQLLAAPPKAQPFKPGPRTALISALIGQQSGSAVGP